METQKQLFFSLKKEVQNIFLQNNLVSNTEISEWKGEDIVKFQEDLFVKTKGRVSEKWFYTYFKSDFEKLPRIDMLNLLAQYVDYEDWQDYKFKQQTQNEPIPTPKPLKKAEERGHVKSNLSYWVNVVLVASLLFAAGLAVNYWITFDKEKKTYEFCFYDADTNNRIANSAIEVTLFVGGIPNHGITRSGCYQFDANLDSILMVVNSPFYKKDSIKLLLNALSSNTQIELTRDDYNIMLYNYSRGNAEERVKKLEEIIHPDAKIYRFYEGQMSREILTRNQYATFLSVPTTSLENFEILATEKDSSGRITMIKFIIRENEN